MERKFLECSPGVSKGESSLAASRRQTKWKLRFARLRSDQRGLLRAGMFSVHFRAQAFSMWNFYIHSLWASAHSPKTYKLDWIDDCKLPSGTKCVRKHMCVCVCLLQLDQEPVQNVSLYLICRELRSSWSWINSLFLYQSNSCKLFSFLQNILNSFGSGGNTQSPLPRWLCDPYLPVCLLAKHLHEQV